MNGSEAPVVTICPPDPQLSNWPYPPDSDVPRQLSDYFRVRLFYGAIERNLWTAAGLFRLAEGGYWNRKKQSHQ